jgi:hypothetical protein
MHQMGMSVHTRVPQLFDLSVQRHAQLAVAQ